jgi:hypothetical protein
VTPFDRLMVWSLSCAGLMLACGALVFLTKNGWFFLAMLAFYGGLTMANTLAMTAEGNPRLGCKKGKVQP